MDWINVQTRLPLETTIVEVKANDIVTEWIDTVEAYICPEYGNCIWQQDGEDYVPIITEWREIEVNVIDEIIKQKVND
jgi:hypothetical protein